MPAASENSFGFTPMADRGLAPPHLVEGSVLRKRLLLRACGEQLPAAHLCLVSAPAGYGKSTFLVQCRQRLCDRGLTTAWLTLDEEDNEESLFLGQLGAAFNQFNPAITRELVASRLAQGGEFSGRCLVTWLIGFLDPSREYALFVDDYHHIHNPDVHQLLQSLLLYLPGNLYLFIGSRSMPPIPLSRYSAAGDLLLLDSDDLGFDMEETRILLRDVNHLQVSGEETALLWERTGGWAAVLQLTALSMQGSVDHGRLVGALSTDSGSVADFLVEKVLAQMPGTLAGFLRRIAILDRFCAPLCLAVTGDREHSFQLARLRDSHLPLQSLDESDLWYRLHPLFHNALLRQLESVRAEELVEMHRRASAWFEEHGLMAEAIQHAIGAGDENRALELLDEQGISLLAQGYLPQFLGLVRRLPESLLQESRGTLIQLVWLQVLSHRVPQARLLLEQLKSRYTLDPAQQVEVHCVEACLYAINDQLEEAAQLADRWLPRSPQEPIYLHESFRLLQGLAHYYRREYPRALEIARELLAVPTIPDLVLNQAYASCLAALVYLAGARLKEGSGYLERQLENILHQVMPNSQAVALVESMIGVLCYQRGEPWRAETLFQRSREAQRTNANVDLAISILRARVRLLHGSGDTRGAVEYLDEVQLLAEERDWTRLHACIVHERVRLLLALGDLRGARACFDDWQRHRETRPRASQYAQANIEKWMEVAGARLMLAGGDAIKAGMLLKDHVKEAVDRGNLLRAMELLVLLARSHLAEKEPDRAKRALADALALDPESGVIQLFRDEGQEVVAALAALREELGSFAEPGWHTLWQQQIDVIVTPSQMAPADERRARVDLVGPGPVGELTKKELANLSLLVEGRSNREIAERLRLSTDTVKAHLNSAYEKLGVTTRTQAVRRLKQLGFVE